MRPIGEIFCYCYHFVTGKLIW